MNTNTNKKADILIAENQIESLKLLSKVLEEQGYKVRQAIDGEMALIAVEAENALEHVRQKFSFKTRGLTIAPRLRPETHTSQHEWWIAFDEVPVQLEQIAFEIDQQICKQNHLYADLIEGKVIDRLKIIPIQAKAFETCLLKEGKIDGQNKIPILANHRNLVHRLAPYRC